MTDIAPAKAPIQIESTQVNAPVSESLAQTMGTSINYALINSGQLGDIVTSILDTAQFQSLRDTTWVLCNGQSCAGSAYEALTGYSVVPDARGRYQRMKDNGAGVDPHGDLPLGDSYADQFASHTHGVKRDPSSGFAGSRLLNGDGTATVNVFATGGSETNPKTIIFNFFIKINY